MKIRHYVICRAVNYIAGKPNVFYDSKYNNVLAANLGDSENKNCNREEESENGPHFMPNIPFCSKSTTFHNIPNLCLGYLNIIFGSG